MKPKIQGMVELALEIRGKTEKAFKVHDGDTTGWLPISQIDWEEPDHIGATTTFYVPEWLAEANGFI